MEVEALTVVEEQQILRNMRLFILLDHSFKPFGLVLFGCNLFYLVCFISEKDIELLIQAIASNGNVASILSWKFPLTAKLSWKSVEFSGRLLSYRYINLYISDYYLCCPANQIDFYFVTLIPIFQLHAFLFGYFPTELFKFVINDEKWLVILF